MGTPILVIFSFWISGMEWWNGTVEWNTGMGNLMSKAFPSTSYAYDEVIRFKVIIWIASNTQPNSNTLTPTLTYI